MLVSGPATWGISDAAAQRIPRAQIAASSAAGPAPMTDFWSLLERTGLQHLWEILAVQHKLTVARVAAYDDVQISKACDVPLADATDLVSQLLFVSSYIWTHWARSSICCIPVAIRKWGDL